MPIQRLRRHFGMNTTSYLHSCWAGIETASQVPLDATDIALSKLERNAERDREDVLRLAGAGYIDPQVLKDRYYEELRPYLLSKLPWHDKTLELWLEMAWPTT